MIQKWWFVKKEESKVVVGTHTPLWDQKQPLEVAIHPVSSYSCTNIKFLYLLLIIPGVEYRNLNICKLTDHAKAT